ncbi:hypothetical protein V6N12_007616 [Hibiscus sabdariffa]|uniref:RNase H type-1 domain-containing protein n=1 Tax=Hibiscus sabdariffa TaxID=183260 RepID=A0ABR2F2A4_9ROSI
MLFAILFLVLSKQHCLTVFNGDPGGLRGVQPPEQSWFKANVDGTVSGSHNMTVVEVVLRDMMGAWIFGTSRSLSSCSILMSKFWTTYDGFVHLWRLGYRKVTLECDNALVVHILNRRSDALPESLLEVRIRELISRNWESQISCKANVVPDALVGMARGCPIGEICYVNHTTEVIPLLAADGGDA